MPVDRIKIVALVEGHFLTGPAKNILSFGVACRDRVDLTVVTFVRTADKVPTELPNIPLVSAVRAFDIPVEIVHEAGPFDLSVLGRLNEIFEAHEADIVETHGIKSHFLLSLLGREKSCWVAFHHGYTNEDLKAHVYHQFDRWSLRFADLVVTVCQEFADLLVRRGVRHDRICVLHNSVNTDLYRTDPNGQQETRQHWGVSLDERIIVSVGRLSAEKGHTYLIDAASKILSESPDLKFRVIIAGCGPLEGKLKEQVQKKGLQKYVQLIGHCSDVAGLFSIADLFVLPSLSEGSPNALLESMAARVPIVATRAGGVPELVKDGESAILIPPANSESLKVTILDLLHNRSRATQLATAAFENACVNFNESKRNEQLSTIYSWAVEKRSD